MRTRPQNLLSLLAIALVPLIAGCAGSSPLTVTPGVHTVLHSCLAPEEALGLQQEADAAVQCVCHYLSVPVPELPAEIRLFNSRRSLKHHLAASCPIMADAAAACYETPDGTLVVTLPRRRKRAETLRLLRHELSHYVIASHYVEIPPWIDEGLAQFFETGPPYGRISPRNWTRMKRKLCKGDAGAVATLVAVVPGTRLTRKQYTLAWGMTQYLLGRKPDGPARVRHYLETVHSGADPAAQFTETFALSLLEMELLLAAEPAEDRPAAMRR